jgi:hypothetical protein
MPTLALLPFPMKKPPFPTPYIIASQKFWNLIQGHPSLLPFSKKHKMSLLTLRIFFKKQGKSPGKVRPFFGKQGKCLVDMPPFSEKQPDVPQWFSMSYVFGGKKEVFFNIYLQSQTI